MASETTPPAVTNTRNGGNTIDINHPYHLTSSDSPGMSLVNSIFDGKGYPGWRRSVLIALSAKKKLGFINGTCKIPDLFAAEHEQWVCCNDMVTSWLLNSLTKEIGDSVIYSKTAKELWDSLEHRFGKSNGAKLYHLRNDPGQGILLSSASCFDLLAFCDADWASCSDSRRSISGFFITLGGAPISWLVRILADLSTPPSLPVPVHSDSQAAIHIAKNPVFHERTKHVELDCHFVRQQFVSGLITLSFVPSKHQLADLFTKPLSGASHRLLLDKLGVVSPPSTLRGDIAIYDSSSIMKQRDDIEEVKTKKKWKEYSDNRQSHKGFD